MVDRRFFDHVSPGGGTMMDRLHAAGWNPGGAWSAGENIAWGSGELGTPARIVDAWMHSAGHRANILNRAFTPDRRGHRRRSAAGRRQQRRPPPT